MIPKIKGVNIHSARGIIPYFVGSPAYSHPDNPMITEIRSKSLEFSDGIAFIYEILGENETLIAELIDVPIEVFFDLLESEV